MLLYWTGNLLRIIILATQIRSYFTQFLHINDIEIFQDFLNYNKLHHGLLIVNKRYNQKLNLHEEENLLLQLLSKRFIRFYDTSITTTNIVDDKQQFFYYKSPRLGVFVSNLTSSLTQRKVLQSASDGNFFNSTQSWLLLMMPQSDGKELTTFRNIFEHYTLNVDADITLGVRQIDNTVILYDVFKICHKCGSNLEIIYKGNWTKATGFNLLPEFLESFVRRRRNFHGLHLKGSIGLLEKPKNTTWSEYLEDAVDNKHLDTMQRKTYHLLKNMPNTFNFSFDVLYTTSWGKNENGNWTGVIGHLVSGEAEFALCPIRHTFERVHTIRFSPPLHTEVATLVLVVLCKFVLNFYCLLVQSFGSFTWKVLRDFCNIRFLLRHPRRNVLRNIFLEPFVETIWWCIFAIILCSILLLRLLLKQEYCIQQRRQHQHQNCTQTTEQQQHEQQQHEQQQHDDYITTNPLEYRLDFSMLMILAAVLFQGPSPDAFNLISTRTLITTICVFSVLLLQFYGAFILDSLLADTPRTITNVHALYNSTLDIGMEDISYNYDFFINTTNQEAKDIYAHRISQNPRGNILTMTRGVERIGRGGFAFHTGVERAYRILKYKLTELEFCDLQEIALYPPFISSAVTRLDSPYREHFANSILHLRATGLMQYNDKMWQVKKTDCSLAKSIKVEVDIEHFAPALAFLAFAMLITLFTLLLEVVINWQQHKQPKTQLWKRQQKTKMVMLQDSKQNGTFALH